MPNQPHKETSIDGPRAGSAGGDAAAVSGGAAPGDRGAARPQPEANETRGRLSRFEAMGPAASTESSGSPGIDEHSASQSGAETVSSPPLSRAEGPRAEGADSTSASRVRVEVDGVHRPFMLGILVRSLTEQGLSFEDAYEASQEVWQRVRDRQVLPSSELREIVREIAAAASVRRDFSDPLGADLAAQIQVLGKNGRWPFNQGRLQQSLLAAGVEPKKAFEVVIEMEHALRLRGETRVSRDVLRTLGNDILTRRFGEDYALRYRSWRSFQNDDERPLILLLGGTSGVGKSSLAIEVARRLSIARVLSTDSIRDVMRVMLSDDLVPTLHVSSFEAHSRLATDVREGEDPVIEGFIEQSRTVCVGVRAVIERAIAEGTNTVIDGVSLVPGLLDLQDWSGRAHVYFLLAADENRESLHDHLVARAHGRGARASERYVRSFQEIFRIQEDLLERAEAAGLPVVDVQDLEAAAQEVVSHVVSRLGDARSAEAQS
ncbi:MAG: hypothetical protein AB8G23_21460 [Myxococcota bacterium]